MNEADLDVEWVMFARALAILDGKASGHALPILRKLVRRRFAPASTVLSDFVPTSVAIRLLRSAAMRGDATSAYNLAIEFRNAGDLGRYRLALARAARLDSDAALERKRFETRFPEQVMRRFKRLSGRRRRD